MKRLLLLWLSVSLVFVLFSSNTFAQDYTRWNLPEGAKARLGKGLLSGSIAYSPDGTRLAVSANIGIWLYDAHSGAEIDLFTGQALSVNSVAFSPDGYILAGGSGDGTIRLWSVETGAHIQTLTGHTRGIKKIAFNPDGNTIVSGSYDETIRLWDAATGTHKRTLRGHSDGVNSVALNPNGACLPVGVLIQPSVYGIRKKARSSEHSPNILTR